MVGIGETRVGKGFLDGGVYTFYHRIKLRFGGAVVLQHFQVLEVGSDFLDPGAGQSVSDRVSTSYGIET